MLRRLSCGEAALALRNAFQRGAPTSAGAPGSPGAENGRDQRERQTDAQVTGSFRRENASYQYRKNGSGSVCGEAKIRSHYDPKAVRCPSVNDLSEPTNAPPLPNFVR